MVVYNKPLLEGLPSASGVEEINAPEGAARACAAYLAANWDREAATLNLRKPDKRWVNLKVE